VIIDFRPTSRLRGAKPIDATAAIAPVFEALYEDPIDLARLRMACDWIQYRANFRNPVDLRKILPPTYPGVDGATTAPGMNDELEIAIDLRRSADESQRAAVKATAHDLLAAHRGEPSPTVDERVVLEDWRPGSQSCIWQFNRLYWQALDLWEKATGQMYESALPGGESDARNTAAVRELIRDMFRWWDQLAARNALPDELYVVELGVGNGNQATTWLDEFRAVEAEEGREYYRRLHYLMCDYSPHVLEMARETVAAHQSRVSSFVLDATKPTTALAFLKYKVFLVYISNVYDNLPTDEVARIGGRTYLVETRAYLPGPAAAALAQDIGVEVDVLPGVIEKLLRLGPAVLADALPAHFSTADDTVEFWRRVWEGIRLEERYAPMAGLDLYQIAPGASGELLRPILESGGDIRMHVNNGAVASFIDTLPLLHPYGRLLNHDLFVRDADRYRSGFLGPGKYDGSVVNWINGPLLTLVGARKGFDVRFEPFRHREGTNIVTMTAQVRD
jgi:putative S-adenosyl-L-methionine-dependent methyltransferase